MTHENGVKRPSPGRTIASGAMCFCKATRVVEDVARSHLATLVTSLVGHTFVSCSIAKFVIVLCAWVFVLFVFLYNCDTASPPEKLRTHMSPAGHMKVVLRVFLFDYLFVL